MNRGYKKFTTNKITELRRPPHVSTHFKEPFPNEWMMPELDNVQNLFRFLEVEGMVREQFPRLTLDFDGSVLSTKGHAQGRSVGFNKTRKGARRYYPLFCTIAQTGKFFYMHLRSGNVHDSNGASEFMQKCFEYIRSQFPGSIIESRMDGAFFNRKIIDMMSQRRISFTASVPFYRFFKQLIKTCDSWIDIDANWSYFETQMMAHNLSREMQMVANPGKTRARSKRPAGWTFKRLDTIRHQILQRADRFIKPQEKLTLVMSTNRAVKKNLVYIMDKLLEAA